MRNPWGDPRPACVQATRTEFGRAKSSMRLRAWMATSVSVARRWSVRKRNPSPSACLNLPIVASTRAGEVSADAFYQAARPCSAMTCFRNTTLSRVEYSTLAGADRSGGFVPQRRLDPVQANAARSRCQPLSRLRFRPELRPRRAAGERQRNPALSRVPGPRALRPGRQREWDGSLARLPRNQGGPPFGFAR